MCDNNYVIDHDEINKLTDDLTAQRVKYNILLTKYNDIEYNYNKLLFENENLKKEINNYKIELEIAKDGHNLLNQTSKVEYNRLRLNIEQYKTIMRFIEEYDNKPTINDFFNEYSYFIMFRQDDKINKIDSKCGILDCITSISQYTIINDYLFNKYDNKTIIDYMFKYLKKTIINNTYNEKSLYEYSKEDNILMLIYNIIKCSISLNKPLVKDNNKYKMFYNFCESFKDFEKVYINKYFNTDITKELTNKLQFIINLYEFRINDLYFIIKDSHRKFYTKIITTYKNGDDIKLTINNLSVL